MLGFSIFPEAKLILDKFLEGNTPICEDTRVLF